MNRERDWVDTYKSVIIVRWQIPENGGTATGLTNLLRHGQEFGWCKTLGYGWKR